LSLVLTCLGGICAMLPDTLDFKLARNESRDHQIAKLVVHQQNHRQFQQYQ